MREEPDFLDTLDRATLKAMLDDASVGIFVCDHHGNVLMANKEASRIWGGIAFVGLERYREYKGWWSATGERLKSEDWGLARAIAEGEASQNELVDIEAFDGTRRTILNAAKPIRDADGRVVGGIAIVHDVTKAHRDELALRESEERFKSAFEHAAIGMALVAPDGRWLKVNRSTCEMLGYSADELLTMDFQLVTHPDDLASDLGKVRAMLAGEIQTYQMEKRYFHKRGSLVWALLSVSLVRDAAGRPLYFVSQIQDITTRKEAEQALQDRERLFRAIFNQTFQFAGLLDRDGAVREINDSFLAAAHLAREAAFGRGLADLPVWDATTAARLGEALARARAGEFVRLEVAMAIAGEAARALDMSIKPIKGEGDRVSMLLAEARDVTEWKAALEGLAQRTAELSQAKEIDRLKSNFVNAVSHELRTPLTSIKGYGEFLEDEIGGPVTPTQREYLEQIMSSTARLERQVDDLLDFARIDAGTFSMRIQPADLGQVATDIVESLRPQARRASIDLRVGAQDAPVVAPMDAQRVGQVVTNLLANAIKFTPEGGAIELRIRTEGPEAVVEVVDSGPGIAEADLPKLFQRFSQLDAGVKLGCGTGLGLSISKAIVEAHGGRIGVLSHPGEGSTFWFTLPTKAASRARV